LFWDQLTTELAKKYNVTENRFFEFANSQYFPVTLKSSTVPLHILECEYIIEFNDTGEFYVLSVSDALGAAALNERGNPLLKKVLLSQFNREEIEAHVGHYTYKYSPWIYFPSIVLDLDAFYQKRKNITQYIDKFYFRGTSIEDRSILSHLRNEYFEGPRPIGSPDTYFEDIIKYKIGLSVGGRGELCYRDIEYMALGIPFLIFEYTSKIYPDLIPNYHYISVARPDNLKIDRIGNAEHAALLEQKFLDVKDNSELLNNISKNARDYYDTYLSDQTAVSHTLKLLNI